MLCRVHMVSVGKIDNKHSLKRNAERLLVSFVPNTLPPFYEKWKAVPQASLLIQSTEIEKKGVKWAFHFFFFFFFFFYFSPDSNHTWRWIVEYFGGKTSTLCRPEVSALPCVLCTKWTCIKILPTGAVGMCSLPIIAGVWCGRSCLSGSGDDIQV